MFHYEKDSHNANDKWCAARIRRWRGCVRLDGGVGFRYTGKPLEGFYGKLRGGWSVFSELGKIERIEKVPWQFFHTWYILLAIPLSSLGYFMFCDSVG